MTEENQDCCQGNWCSPKTIIKLLGVLLLGAVVIVSLLRDRIVNEQQWQVSVAGQGKVSYQPDIAVVTLGVQVDKISTAEGAMKQLNEKVNKVVTAMKAMNIPAEDLQTQNYSLYPQYDYKNGVSVPSGYSANEQLNVKVKNINENSDQLSRLVGEATKAGANQITSITFDVSNLNDLKQAARLKAIADAKSKAGDLAKTAGVKLGKVVGWWENIIQVPGNNPVYSYSADGKGGGAGAPAPQIPNGNQEVIIEISLNYKVK